MNSKSNPAAPQPERLLAWYDRHRRHMPWRCAPGQTPDAYHIWLSEIMLQQTTVATVRPYFDKFVKRWPHLEDFAASDLDDVLKMWAGLGYYARARNLHKCARIVMNKFGGNFPASQDQLLHLPGIGPYTSAAIMAIAFDRNAVVVDGNVERVIARIFAIEKPLPYSKPLLKKHAASLTPDTRPGDYAQAIMDLGATVCKPKAPQCPLCPWQSSCRAHHQGIQEKFPQKIKNPAKPRRHGTAFWLEREDGKILLRKRRPNGLLGAMMEIPSSPWIDRTQIAAAKNQPHTHAPAKANWQKQSCETVKHTFTHFHLEMTIWQARTGISAKLSEAADEERCSWVSINDLDNQALPTLMRKIINAAMNKP